MIDAFRLINPNMMVLGQEPRQTTSVLGHLQKPSIQALIHGLNRHYYSISINYRKNELEQRMLMNLNKKSFQRLTGPSPLFCCRTGHRFQSEEVRGGEGGGVARAGAGGGFDGGPPRRPCRAAPLFSGGGALRPQPSPRPPLIPPRRRRGRRSEFILL